MPKGIFLTECKVNSKNLHLEIERKTHKCQTANKNILSYFWAILSGGTPNIHYSLCNTQTYTPPPPPKLSNTLICVYIMMISKVWELWSL